MKFLIWLALLIILWAVGVWPVAAILPVCMAVAKDPDFNSPFYKAWGTVTSYWRKIW
jgi:hypothetical protein